MYDFLLVFNSNLGPISKTPFLRYSDLLAKIYTPLSFSALAQCDPVQIYGKALWILKLRVSGQPSVKIR